MQEYKMIDYEAEETLSLSNLVTHDVSAWENDYSSRDISSLEQDRLFEFLTDEWSAKIKTAPQHGHHQNIIFCGKLIQSKKCNNNSDTSVHSKLLGLTSSSRRSRWYMLFFSTAPGSLKTSGEAQLREIKRRLSNRQIEGGQHEYRRKKSKGGLWGLVKALGCGEINHATAVSDSIKCISRV